MNIQEILNKRAIDVTVDELATVIATKITATDMQPQPKEKRMLRGIKGIMEVFQCSRTKASEMKLSGILDKAIIQHGRTFVIDADEALKIVGGLTHGKRHS